MHSFRQFVAHKFSIRQSLLIITASLVAGFIANETGTAAGLPHNTVTAVVLAAGIATLVPLMVVIYRRTRA